MSLQRSATIHSPEHVEITLQPAGLGRRGAAALVDLALITGACGAVQTVGGILPAAIAAPLVITICLVIFWGYWIGFELLAGGRTPGKRICGLRVVDGRGLPLDAGQSLIRNVARAVDLLPLGGVGLISAMIDRRRRRLGDLLADTLVLEERSLPAVDFGSLSARRYNSLQTARMRKLVDHRLGTEDRELLLALCVRAGGLDEGARHALFESVGTHYRELLEIEDSRLTGEAVVRGLASLCHGRTRNES